MESGTWLMPPARMSICGRPRTSMIVGVLCPKVIVGNFCSHFTLPVALS